MGRTAKRNLPPPPKITKAKQSPAPAKKKKPNNDDDEEQEQLIKSRVAAVAQKMTTIQPAPEVEKLLWKVKRKIKNRNRNRHEHHERPKLHQIKLLQRLLRDLRQESLRR